MSSANNVHHHGVELFPDNDSPMMEKDNDIIKLISSAISTTDSEQEPDSSATSEEFLEFSAAPVSITGALSNIEDEYIVDPKVLGTGHDGAVRTCVNRSTGERFAVKTIRKTESAAERSDLAREIKLLQEMQHPSIIRLIDVYEDAECLHIITDLCTGGELFYKIVKRASGRKSVMPCFEENEAAGMLHQILKAVSYMHKHGIVHRDLKPENILFADASDDSPLKIIDFGLSQKHARGEAPMSTIVGSPFYIAPEVLRQKYDRSCDLWSVGVIAYILLCGYPPFRGDTTEEVHESVLRGRSRFPPDWSGVSREARSFVRRLLQKDPTRRMTAEQALNHPWMAKHIDDDASMSVEVVQEKSLLEVMYQGLSRRDLNVHHDTTKRKVKRSVGWTLNQTGIATGLGLQWTLRAVDTVFLWVFGIPAAHYCTVTLGGGLDAAWTSCNVPYVLINASPLYKFVKTDWYKIRDKILAGKFVQDPKVGSTTQQTSEASALLNGGDGNRSGSYRASRDEWQAPRHGAIHNKNGN